MNSAKLRQNFESRGSLPKLKSQAPITTYQARPHLQLRPNSSAMRSSTLRALRLLAFNSQPVCQTCFRRTFVSTAPLRVRNESPKPPAPAIAEKQPQEPEEFEDPRARPLQPLGKPIGFKHPPKPSDNDPVDRRTWRERRDDFHNYDKHLEKRQAM